MAKTYVRGFQTRETVSVIDAIVYLTVSMPKQEEKQDNKAA